MENTPCFNCQEHINLQILKFNFQGSQKLHVRVTKSPNGLGKSILKTIYFLPPASKTYVGPIGFYSYNFLTYRSLWNHVLLLLLRFHHHAVWCEGNLGRPHALCRSLMHFNTETFQPVLALTLEFHPFSVCHFEWFGRKWDWSNYRDTFWCHPYPRLCSFEREKLIETPPKYPSSSWRRCWLSQCQYGTFYWLLSTSLQRLLRKSLTL